MKCSMSKGYNSAQENRTETKLEIDLYLVNNPFFVYLKSFSAKGKIELFANNTDSGESARNELSHLKSALFAFWLSK